MGNTEEEIPFFNVMLPTLMKRVPELELHQLKKKKIKWNLFDNTLYEFGMQKHSLGNVAFDLSVLYKVYQIHG